MNKLDLESHCNGQAPGSGTQPVEKAIPFFLKVLQIITCMIGARPEILEVGAGNGWNTKELQRVSKLKWIVTDAQKHEPSYCPINVLKAKDAINNYINKWNTWNGNELPDQIIDGVDSLVLQCYNKQSNEELKKKLRDKYNILRNNYSNFKWNNII